MSKDSFEFRVSGFEFKAIFDFRLKEDSRALVNRQSKI